MGCKLIVRMEGDEVIKILGNRCRRGEAYGRQEAIAPQRMVASTVKIPQWFPSPSAGLYQRIDPKEQDRRGPGENSVYRSHRARQS